MKFPNLAIVTAPTLEDIGIRTAQMIKELSPDATVAVSGGTTYKTVCNVWREALGDHRVNLFLVDERVVPFQSPDSNWGMVNSLLLDPLEWPSSKRCFVKEMSEHAAGDYEDLLRSLFDTPMPRFDLVFLGMGLDGHTASLFPKTEALNDHSSWVLRTEAPSSPKERVTLGMGAICSARHVVIIATGKNKMDVVEQMLQGNETLPIVKVLMHPVRKTLFLDHDAAGE